MNRVIRCKQFWLDKKTYPSFGPKERRLHELRYLLPRLSGKSLIDLGCGDGTLLSILNKITDMKLRGYDLNPSLSEMNINFYDVYSPTKLPKTDNLILFGVLPYLLDDESIDRLLQNIRAKNIFVRTTCNEKDLTIDKYSKDLKGDYVARYQTLDGVIKCLSKRFKVIDVSRAYPDRLDSKYGTKQYFIWLK